MTPRTFLSAVYAVCLTVLFLGFLSAAASAQQVKITIRCLPEESGQETKKENPKDKKPEAGNRREKPARFELNGKNEKSADRESLVEEANIIPIGCVAQAIITVYTGPPGATVDYTVTQSNPSNIVELKRFLQNPYGNTVVIPVSLDASGYGVSSPFYVRGKILGETTLIGTSSFNNTTPLNILVVECKCPVIPANTPPRN